MANWIDTIFGAFPSSGQVQGFKRATRKFVVGAVDKALAWQERAAQRDMLAKMDERMLKDMGINPADAAHEARKPFWTC